ncbi:hypothetical protein ENBRE01_1351 [Enteropsectra breve]|nr:hypothetical protein ENBRE01_1351 [Enteropsectra breve]
MLFYIATSLVNLAWSLEVLELSRNIDHSLAFTLYNKHGKLQDCEYSEIICSSALLNCNMESQSSSNEIFNQNIALSTNLLIVTKVREAIRKEACKYDDTPENFSEQLRKLEEQRGLYTNKVYVEIKQAGEKRFQISDSIEIHWLKIILRMRRELIHDRIIVLQENLSDLINAYSLLKYSEGSHADIFLRDTADSQRRHVVMECNILFAINLAIAMHHANCLQDCKNALLSDKKHSLNILELIEALEGCTLEKAVITIIEIKQENERLTDIFIGKDNELFGYGSRIDGTLTLRPCAAFENSAFERASVFRVFDLLTAFYKINQLKALCHEAFGIGQKHFFTSLIRVFKFLEDIEMEASEQVSFVALECDSFLEIIEAVLIENADIIRNVTSFSIIGYNTLSKKILDALKTKKFRHLGLLCESFAINLSNIRYLFTFPCELKKSIIGFAGSPVCALQLSQLLDKNQLEEVVFILGTQSVVPLSEVIKNINKEISNEQIRLKLIIINYRFHYYVVKTQDSMPVLKKEFLALKSTGVYEKFIFQTFSADNNIPLASKSSNFELVDNPSAKRVFITIRPDDDKVEESLKNAFRLLGPENGRILISCSFNKLLEKGCGDLNRGLFSIFTEIGAAQEHSRGNLKIIISIRILEKNQLAKNALQNNVLRWCMKKKDNEIDIELREEVRLDFVERIVDDLYVD